MVKIFKALILLITCFWGSASYSQDSVFSDSISNSMNIAMELNSPDSIISPESDLADTLTMMDKAPVLLDITSRSRKGYKDLSMTIVEKQLEDGVWIITAKGTYNDSVVGLGIRIKDSLKPGLKNGTIDNTSWARDGVEMLSIGPESDSFVKILSEMYGYHTKEPFTEKPLIFTCFSLNSEVAALADGLFEFKLYFDDSNESGIYSEIFFNTNLPEGIIEFPDKDPIHFDGFIKALVR